MPPQFIQAGTGTLITTGTASASLTNATAGDLIVIHLMQRGISADWGDSNTNNIEQLNGTGDALTQVVTNRGVGSGPASQHSLLTGRVMSDGTVSTDFIVGASGEDLLVRFYEFRGVINGSTVAAVFENEDSSVQSANGISNTVADRSLTTHGDSRLGCAFVALIDDLAIGPFTGESGGDWVEPVAEYVEAGGATGTLQLQTADLPISGTLDGGTVTIGASTSWGVITTGIIGTAGPGDNPPMGFRGRGAGW